MKTPLERSPSVPSTTWTSVVARPRIWGLGVDELLDAWWRSQGVLWVRRGHPIRARSRADLYLLTEPSQGAMFELRPLASALTWNRPSLTRVRLVSSRGDDYRERVVTSEHGGVIAVRRAVIACCSPPRFKSPNVGVRVAIAALPGSSCGVAALGREATTIA